MYDTNIPHLAIFSPGVGSGGPWRYVHSLLAALDPAEFRVSVFCDIEGEYTPCPRVRVIPWRGSPQRRQLYEVASTQAASIRTQGRALLPRPVKVWAGFMRESRRLARIFRQHNIQLMHTQNTGCEESAVAAKLAGIPHVLGTFHVDSTYDLHRVRHGMGHRSLEVFSNRCLDQAIAVSEATRKDWLQRTHIPADRVVTIHNGIDPEKFCRHQTREQARQVLNLPQDAMVIGGLGRLDEAKGFGDLITAAGLLRDEFPRMCVAIAGAGPLQSELEGQIERLGLSGVVRLVGFQRDVQVVLDALDVYAIPSLCEALPYALLEAMATELPVVGSAVGGIPEVIVEGETGFVVPSRQPARLAQQLRTLLLNDELRQRMGVAGRQRVIQYFHERDMVRKTIELYRQYLRPVQTNNNSR